MSEMGDTEIELERLTRRLDRERRARIEAETIAERGMRELFLRQQELLLLESIAQAANTSSLQEAMTFALERICLFTGWLAGRLALVERADHGTVTAEASGHIYAMSGDRPSPIGAALDRTEPAARAGAAGRVIEGGQPFYVENVRLDPDYASLAAVAPEEARGVVAFPVLVGREVVGVLEFVTGAGFALTDELRAIMNQIGTHLGRTLERERARAHLIDAFHDPLTKLPNRALFLRELGRALRRARHSSTYRFAVLFVDLDGFKVVNDSLGHGAGDELLAQIALRLTESLRKRDTVARTPEGQLDLVGGPTVARIGGDEFTILLDQISHPDDALRVARRIQQNLAPPFDVGGQELYASASIGVAMGDVGHVTSEDLLRDADVAMYRAKSLGKGRCELFDRTMLRRAAAQLQLETDIRHALARNQLRLLFQPIVSLVQSRVVAFEALLRWAHPERGQLAPSDFLSIADDTGVILSLGEWTLTEAVVQLRRWQQFLTDGQPLAVAVNLSARQFLEPGLIGVVRRIVHLADLAPGTLRIELTDADVAPDPARLREVVNALGDLAVPVTLDDFGSGRGSVASLSYLHVRAIKLDRSLIGQLETSVRTRTVARGVVGLAHRLDLDVIAEGVESAAEVEQLLAVGCPFAQGYYFAPPVDAEAVPETLRGLTARLRG
jgi:predicted signal transduction protein with EAL and GGDEF domain